MFESKNYIEKRLQLLREQLAELEQHGKGVNLFLNLAMLLTFLFYLAFALNFYLGDMLHLGVYLQGDAPAIAGAAFLGFISFLLSLVLAGIKHTAYHDFALYGRRLKYIVFAVIFFALFAEVFQSSSNQDTKAKVLVESSAEFQNLNKPVQPSIVVSSRLGDLSAQLAKAEAAAKGCKTGCGGHDAKIAGLKASIAAEDKTNQLNAEASVKAATEIARINHQRIDDKTKDSYNPIIKLFISLGLSIAAANILVVLIISASFETLHEYLSKSKEQNLNAIRGLKEAIIKIEAGLEDGDYKSPSLPSSVKPVKIQESESGKPVTLNKPPFDLKPSLNTANQSQDFKLDGVGFMARLKPTSPTEKEQGQTYRQTLTDKDAPIRDLPLDSLVNQSTLGQLGQPADGLTGQLGQVRSGQLGQVNNSADNLTENEPNTNNLADEKVRLGQVDLAEKVRLAEDREEALKAKRQAESELLKAQEEAEKVRLAEVDLAEKVRLAEVDLAEKVRLAEVDLNKEKVRLAEEAEKVRLAEVDLAEKVRLAEVDLEAEKVRLGQVSAELSEAEKERARLDELKGFTEEQINAASYAIKSAIKNKPVNELGFNNLAEFIKEAGLPRSSDAIRALIKLGCRQLETTGLVKLNPNYSRGKSLYVINT